MLLGVVEEPSADADGAWAVEKDVGDVRLLSDGDAVLASGVHEQLVEFAAEDLPGLRALVGVRLREIERLGQFSGIGDELDAFLADEVAGAEFVDHAGAFHGTEGERHKRFADVEPREFLAFEQEDASAELSEDRGAGSAGGP